MTIIDRYVLRQFVQIFLICFLSLGGLYVVIDAFQHLDSFSSYASEKGSLLGAISEYYAYQAFDLFDRTAGILAMIAAMFTVTWMQRHQELTAIMAAGISKFRAIRPIMIAAIMVSFLGMLNRELVIPQVRHELTRDTKDLSGSEQRDLEQRLDWQTEIVLGGEKTVAKEQRIVNPNFVLPDSLSKYGMRLVAENGYYLASTEDHPAGYLLDEVSIPKNIDKVSSLRSEGRALIVTHKDATWLKPGQAFVVSNVPFELLANGSSWRHYASIGEMLRELNEPSTEPRSDLRVAVHTRILQPFMDTTMLMLGLPLMFSRRNRNVFVSIGICLAAGIAFSMVTLVCQSLGGLSLLRPTLAAWLPLLLFVPVAVALGHSFRT
ncbi:LptF/LptG family permease [Bythopirellula goksoeyrii]|uniref:Putative permease YjgP/YjgQ family protein n=1 Tax=Bythopirellula goksoeyrii TaxID=1400387 RepID=A0A5B9Q574_9BACT|nr:LptF/LptG family permease [Bythopirellula goksoeyrii]QEG34194.1 putative permease YjgP/YjgQ family protein [Bythopirellula goksoeyrii]